MKALGYFLVTLGTLGCLWAGFVGTMTAAEGAGAIAVAIAAVGGLLAGIWLLKSN